ncbi:segregation and condensation protein A [Marinigracilibium pacificum]|uniref:Segregation and condensation protein A n=1 Tax=Marinigracilibium pacificum TaxID=2729599 RepID=A0A848ISW4_9BACT|nr:segregation/condensation protein A [Marinigracilibium pacificum]NMM47417.1 segregation/condensation protein A [Marinigracilibium pacificum]
MSFEIKLPLFEGPFDLLLFFIERDELDIYDIPISKITLDFLDYLKHLEQMNIEVASEFILVASTLMRIKSKMLLPRPELDELGNEIDPREELVKHLLEYKKYKSVIKELAEMEGERITREKRGNITKELRKLSESTNVEAELQDIDLFKLLKVYRKVLEKYEIEQSRPRHQVVQYPYTIDGQKQRILNWLSDKPRVSFEEVISKQPDKIAVIFNFLSILELLQLNLVTLHIGEGFNNFWIEKITMQEA